jgi:hypothetical protein
MVLLGSALVFLLPLTSVVVAYPHGYQGLSNEGSQLVTRSEVIGLVNQALEIRGTKDVWPGQGVHEKPRPAHKDAGKSTDALGRHPQNDIKLQYVPSSF